MGTHLHRVIVPAALVVWLATSAQAGTLSVVGQGSWAGKALEYPNPFDPNLDRSVTGAETAITSAPGWSVEAALQNAVSRVDGRDRVVRLRQDGASGSDGPATWAEYRPAAAFGAGTVIAWQSVWTGFTGSMPYEVRLGAGASPSWPSIAPVVTDEGAPGSQDIHVANTSGSYDALRLDYPQTARYSTTWYADHQDVAVLPDRLERIPNQSIVASSGADWGTTDLLTDMNGNSGWATWTGATPWYVTLGLGGGIEPVDALMIYSFENIPVTFMIQDDAGNDVALVTMTTGPAGWAVPIQLTESLNTSSITLEFLNTDQVALREIIALRKLPEPMLIPEPATMALLGLGGLGVLVRRRKR